MNKPMKTGPAKWVCAALTIGAAVITASCSNTANENNTAQAAVNHANKTAQSIALTPVPAETQLKWIDEALKTGTDLTSYGQLETLFVKDREFGNIGFFEHKLGEAPVRERTLYADEVFNADTDNTKDVQTAVRWAGRPDKKTGKAYGLVTLLPAKNGQNRFSLSAIEMSSNIKFQVHPDVIIEMRGVKEDNKYRASTLFAIGRSRGPNNLLQARTENVEITSTDPNRNFTIDARTNMPHNYGSMSNAYGGIVNLTRAVPVGIYYAKNFKVSNMTILDNHTESVTIQIASDRDYKDGAYAYRFGRKPVFLKDRYQKNKDGKNKPMGKANIPLPMDDDGNFVDETGQIIPDMFAIQRNPTYGRTPIKGTVKNIKSINAHTGYGTVQVYGGDWIEIDNIESFNGIGVRVEAGNGTNRDNSNRAGPYLTSANKIKISNVKVVNGFTGVWLKTHAKVMKDIHVHNVEAIDSGTALLIGKGSFACKNKCRDLTRGRINDLKITGDIVLRQTKFDKPVAEVGNLATYMINDFNRAYLAKQNGKSIDNLGRGDLQTKRIANLRKLTDAQKAAITPDDFDNPSGSRWYTIFPTAPVLLFNQYSATEVGDQSPFVGYFPVDLSQANIVSDGLPNADVKVLYRSDMRLPNGEPATDFINK
ncbi:hypothetical protein DS2_13639 [Catenovulum agarivorans DS-2]|uniref:Uncharacterized protein n=1 Tax=Catenovulum agarivorans DS-2 TaxID=1328313 RepID=W7QJQ8_9ALTE|nr:hypothetical protein [Catenovulum agarivorans]EWH09207.1 hypothetical protein DS2_13639 [Catenovulum agarivorans DS-2]